MRDQATKIRRNSAPISVLTIAFLLFAFGFVAQQVTEGKSLAFDRRVILALRDPANPSAPAARHGSGGRPRPNQSWQHYSAGDHNIRGRRLLFLARKYAAAWLMLIAVFGGIALSDLLKFSVCTPSSGFGYSMRLGSSRQVSRAAMLHYLRLPI